MAAPNRGWAKIGPLGTTYPTIAEFLAAQGIPHGGVCGGIPISAIPGTAWHEGLRHYEDFYDEDLVVSVTETLRCFGTWPLPREFDATAGQRSVRNRKELEQINRDFLDWLSEQESGRPFFAFLNLFDAHSPYVLPGNCEHRFSPDKSTANLDVLSLGQSTKTKRAGGRTGPGH